MGKMNVLDEHGDTVHTWASSEEAQVVAGVFAQLRARGYLAARMLSGGERGEVITEFDPMAESIMLMPPLRGG